MSDIVKEILSVVSRSLQIPTIIILILLILLTILMLGSFIAEIFTERKSLKMNIPGLVDQLQGKNSTEMKEAIETSGLLNRQKESARELINRTSYSDDTREALARQLIADEDIRYNRIVKITDLVARVAPMFGLMGTLIPLGPGLIALGQGDISTLSSSLHIAFDTTVAGLISGAISFVISGIRKNWYEEYMTGLETVMETILDVQSQEREAAGFQMNHSVPLDLDAPVKEEAAADKPEEEGKKKGRFKLPGSKATAVDMKTDQKAVAQPQPEAAQTPARPQPQPGAPQPGAQPQMQRPGQNIQPQNPAARPVQPQAQAPRPVQPQPAARPGTPEMLNIDNVAQELKAEDVVSDINELVGGAPQQVRPQAPQQAAPQQVRPQQAAPQQVRPQQVSPRRETLTQPVQPHSTNIDPQGMTRQTQTQPHNPHPNSKMEHTMVQRSFQEEVRAAEQAMLEAQRKAGQQPRQPFNRPEGQ